MAKSATHFHPTTDTFGDLTLHARRIGSRFLTVTWSGVHTGIDRAAQSQTLVGIGFLLAFVLFLTSLMLVDQALFTHARDSYEPAQSYYGGVALDYD
ncbi:MAG: hypothetical protein JF615_09760 [Asticcacaulis sp.]|nr:hypothetical protein [Asticcacaulis sp.]